MKIMLGEGPVLYLNYIYSLVSNKVYPNYSFSNNAAVSYWQYCILTLGDWLEYILTEDF